MRGWTRVGALAGTFVILMTTAAVAQAPKGKPATVTGRVVDNICMLGMGLKGEGHRECAMGCDKAGVRMALLDGPHHPPHLVDALDERRGPLEQARRNGG